MTLSKNKYRLDIRKKSVKEWRALESTIPDAMERCKEFLANNPEDRLKSIGKLKKLKGKLSGFLQYDITDEARVWYVVDKQKRIVSIKYVGHHP